MDQVHVIRHAVLKQGRSRRSVALELGVSRNTVRKYLEESEPRFSAPVGRRQPVLERVKARLDELLAEWSARTTAKQRITGSRLHGQLRMEGFDVGITLTSRDPDGVVSSKRGGRGANGDQAGSRRRPLGPPRGLSCAEEPNRAPMPLSRCDVQAPGP